MSRWRGVFVRGYNAEMTAQAAFHSWLVYVVAIGGALLFTSLVAAIVVVALSSRRRED